MTTGMPPFSGKDRNDLFENIKNKDVSYLPSMSPNLKNLLEGLFVKNPNLRLGSNGALRIKYHPWFSNVNWDDIYEKKIIAPFIPKLRNKEDL